MVQSKFRHNTPINKISCFKSKLFSHPSTPSNSNLYRNYTFKNLICQYLIKRLTSLVFPHFVIIYISKPYKKQKFVLILNKK